MPTLKGEKGIGLIEVIAALAISIIVMTALVSLSLHTLRSSSNNKYFQEATALATTQVELLRAFRDTNTWEVFVTSMQGCDKEIEDSGCIASVGSIEYDQLRDPSTGEPVVIYFTAEDPDSPGITGDEQLIRIEVVGVWNLTGNTDDNKETHVYTEFSNWRGT